MEKRYCYFVATFISLYKTKVELSLPLHIVTWIAAISWLSSRVPENHALYSLRIEFPPENLCDNHETQTEEETSAE